MTSHPTPRHTPSPASPAPASVGVPAHAAECVHLLTPATCTYCRQRAPKPAPAPMSERARADALYTAQGARWVDRKPAPRTTARPWSGWRSKGPIGTLHYRRMGVHV